MVSFNFWLWLIRYEPVRPRLLASYSVLNTTRNKSQFGQVQPVSTVAKKKFGIGLSSKLIHRNRETLMGKVQLVVLET